MYKSSEELRRHELRQNIHLEPNDSSSLFGIRPIVQIAAAGGRLPPYINVIDGTISRPEVRSGSYEAYDYTVVSDLDSEKPQGSEDPPNLIRLELLLNIPDELAMRLRQIAEPIVADIKTPGPKGIEEKARKLEEFLRDSGQFGYTLQMDMVNPSLDPVEDFLVNRKEGHCEYFASALALLLRSIDIPSRVVNGFKGGDWNDVTQAMYVRQKHAHSWVEAYLGSSDKRTANWITLDPTPGLARQQSVAEVGGFSSNFRTLSDTIRHIWVFYILGFDANRQNRLVYEPMRAAAKELKRLYLELDLTVRAYAQQLFGFENLDSLISIRGFFVSFIVLTTLMLLIRALIWLYGRLLGIFRDPAADSPSVVAGILFYRRLVQILTKFEIEREPAETQQEFARRAAFFLGARGPETESVAAVPGLIVDAFYRVRFGHLDLSEKTLEMLEERLDALDQTLKTD